MAGSLHRLDQALTIAWALVGEARTDAERRLGVLAGDQAVLDDPKYVAVLDAYGLLVRAVNALHEALDQ